uniref:ATP-binding protein n=1 Tax=Shigella sp. FC1967 TaxID=1898041 RepID=UPI000A97CADC
MKISRHFFDKIELFILYCEELNCWRKSALFPSDDARFHYFYTENSTDCNYEPYPEKGSEVTVLCGLPGMGKDTFIRQHCADLPIVSLDELRRQNNIKPDNRDANGWIAQQAKEQARIYLREHKSFVWNATNITRKMRDQLISLFYRYNAKITLVYIEVPYAQWQRQNNARNEAVPAKSFVWNATNITKKKCEINLSLCFIVIMQKLRWFILKFHMRNGRDK